MPLCCLWVWVVGARGWWMTGNKPLWLFVAAAAAAAAAWLALPLEYGQ